MNTEQCYFCGKESTGVEHIPPKSFFPKGNRIKLITVPSCDEHNQEKSTDDEYIRMIFLNDTRTDGNEKLNKLKDTNKRGLERSAKRVSNSFSKLSKKELKKIILILDKPSFILREMSWSSIKINLSLKDYTYHYNQFCKNKTPLTEAEKINHLHKNHINMGLLGLSHVDPLPELIYDKNGNEIKTISIGVDYERIIKFLEYLSRGLFFYKSNQQWNSKINILPHFLLKSDALEKDKKMSYYYLKHLNKEEAEGQNKDYFYFDGFTDNDPLTGEKRSIFFNFCFYDTFYVTAIFPLIKGIPKFL